MRELICVSACSSMSRSCVRRRSRFSVRSPSEPFSWPTSASMRERAMQTSPAWLTRRSSSGARTRTVPLPAPVAVGATVAASGRATAAGGETLPVDRRGERRTRGVSARQRRARRLRRRLGRRGPRAPRPAATASGVPAASAAASARRDHRHRHRQRLPRRPRRAASADGRAGDELRRTRRSIASTRGEQRLDVVRPRRRRAPSGARSRSPGGAPSRPGASRRPGARRP